MKKQLIFFAVFLVLIISAVYVNAQVDDFPGTCLEFDGINDYVEITNNVIPATGDFTISLWAKAEPNQGGYREMISQNAGTGGEDFYLGKSSGGNIRVGDNWVDSGVPFPNDGLWHYYSVVKTSANVLLYIDGKLEASKGGTIVNPAGNSFRIARQYGPYAEYFTGTIDELRSWNIARDSLQIRESMHLPLTGLESGLTSYYQFNEETGTSLEDIISAFNGSLINMTEDDWVVSTIPFGDGYVNTQVVSAIGSVIFTDTDVEMDFTSKTGSNSIVVTKLELSPNIIPNDTDTAYNDQYWVINQFGTGTFTTNLKFYLSEDLTTEDENNPSFIKLYKRGVTSDESWSYATFASSVNAAENSVIFEGISNLGQFIVCKRQVVIDGFPGTCLEFDGTDDYVNCGSGAQVIGNNPRTIEAWAYTSGFNDGGIFQAGITGSNRADFSLRTLTTDNLWRMQFWGYDMDVVLPESKDSWHHYCLTYDGSNALLYYDGELVGNFLTSLHTASHDVYIGRWKNYYFNGKIDEVRSWDIARTPQQIRENMYLSLNDSETNLISCWQFNDASGTTLDEFVWGNNGTLINMDSTDWKDSSIPFGKGVSNTQTETVGTVNFTGTGLSMDFTVQSGAEITVSRIDTVANINPTQPDNVFDNQYWIVNRYGSGVFDTELRFSLDENLTIVHQNNPNLIALYKRESNADGSWQFLQNADSVNAQNNIAIFSNIQDFSQFIIGEIATTPAVVTTTSATMITPETAISGGEITDSGNSNITAKGVCWSTSANPTIADAYSFDGSGTDSFVSNLTGLSPNTEYHYRAYATNAYGTTYGDDLVFTSENYSPPTLNTTQATFITSDMARSGGNITDEGFNPVTERGVCWSTSTNPTTADFFTLDGTGSGVYVSEINGLSPNTEYYYRAYATNDYGTSYGNEYSLTTISVLGAGTLEDPFRISNLIELRWLSENSEFWDGHFIQTANIDATNMQNWNSGEGFSPIGNYGNPFIGSYDGQGFAIDNLYINKPAGEEQGLFGYMDEATISNLGITNVSITAYEEMGCLASRLMGSTVINCYSTGTITGYSSVGGLIESCSESDIYNCHSSVNVICSDYGAGGFAASIGNQSYVSFCYSAGDVQGNNSVGGFAGDVDATVRYCYSTGNVTGVQRVGGLIGFVWDANVNNSYSTGDVTATNYVGGLVGAAGESHIVSCYSIGQVSGSTDVGGLVGLKNYYYNSYVYSSFWDTETSLQASSDGGTGKTTSEMLDVSTYTDLSTSGLDYVWDFVGNPNDDHHNTNYWDISSTVNNGYPFLVQNIIEIEVTVWLEGPLNGSEMNTSLTNPPVEGFPLVQPYNNAPWNYNGVESITSVSPYMVDWVLIELHDATIASEVSPSTLIEKRAVIIDLDGDIYNAEDYNEVVFQYAFNKSLFIVVHHRNHLSVLSATPLELNHGRFSFDFTESLDRAYNSGQKDLGNGYYGMFAGDINADGTINMDDHILWKQQAGSSAYKSADINMDTKVDNIDKNEVWLDNNNVSTQVPE